MRADSWREVAASLVKPCRARPSQAVGTLRSEFGLNAVRQIVEISGQSRTAERANRAYFPFMDKVPVPSF